MQSIADFPVKKGLYAIGHVRYSTSGGLDFCQPVYAKTNLGEIAVAHNGNLTNAEKLRQTLMLCHLIMQIFLFVILVR